MTTASLTIHANDSSQIETLKAFLKALKIKFEFNTTDEPTKQKIASNLKKGFEEMQLIKNGKLKTTSLADFLNEL